MNELEKLFAAANESETDVLQHVAVKAGLLIRCPECNAPQDTSNETCEFCSHQIKPKKLTREEAIAKLRKIEHLKVLRFRLGRAGSEAPNWEEWQEQPFHIQKRPNGEIAVLVPRNVHSAEYTEQEFDIYENEWTFCAEDYYLELDPASF